MTRWRPGRAVLILGLAAFLLGFPAKGRALTTDPVVLAQCAAEAGTAFDYGMGPVTTSLAGTLSGVALTNFNSMWAGFIFSFFCEQDSIDADIEQLNTTESKIAQALLQGDGVEVKQLTLVHAAEQSNRFGTAQLPPGSCDHAYIANRTGAATQSSAQTAGWLNSQLQNYNRSQPASGIAHGVAAQQTAGQLSPASIFGEGDIGLGGQAPSTLGGAQFIADATNPIPQKPISSYAAAQPQGGAKIAAYNMDTADMAIAQKPMSDVLAIHTPTVSAQDWINGISAATGIVPSAIDLGSGTPATGTISLMNVIAGNVATRFSNPTYVAGVLTGGKTNALREMAAAQATELEIDYQTLLAEQNEETILGTILARMVNRDRP